MHNRIDLHMHSCYSNDGTYTPAELIQLCAEAGLRVVALADHNSVRGVREMQAAGQEMGVEVIPAAEFDCQFMGKFLHILAYGIQTDAPAFAAHEKRVRAVELAASRQQMRNIRALGIAFDEARAVALTRDGIVFGEHIIEAALADSRNADNPLLAPYRPGGSRSDNPLVNFYWDHCSPGTPAYAYIDYPPLDEVLSLIRGHGGVAILAHPGANVGREEALLRKIAGHGVIGLEAYSSYHTEADMAFFVELARKCGWLVTAGSDFHGKTKPAVKMGAFQIEDEPRLLEALRRAMVDAQAGKI